MASISPEELSHLAKRTTFGVLPFQPNALGSGGREAAVDLIINYENIDNTALENLLSLTFSPSFFFSSVEVRRWWLTRMLLTTRPFEEKMTLFWHNHFATSLEKVTTPLMLNQNKTLRSLALGRFDDLLSRISRDPAMLIWLDTISNISVRPNENYSRELQELFSMGPADVITGQANYTEQDVREIAKAFTGWKFRLKRNNPNKPKFFINESEHDNTAKRVYGQVANFSGDDIVTLVASRIETARFMAKKLFQYFAYELTDNVEDKATIQKFADVYVSSNHSIKQLVRSILVSDEFFSPRARNALVRDPVDFVVSAIKILGTEFRTAFNDPVYESPTKMGFELLRPPDVSGWPQNLGWVNTVNLLERFNFASHLASSRTGSGIILSTSKLRQLVKQTARQTVDNLAALFGVTLNEETTLVFVDYLETDADGVRVGFFGDDAAIDQRFRGMLHLFLCLPELQMH